jgi:hypothetical protein
VPIGGPDQAVISVPGEVDPEPFASDAPDFDPAYPFTVPAWWLPGEITDVMATDTAPADPRDPTAWPP